ncbi:MAG TPA: 4-(cytidine 5'-diphospho)-2-C-methyl-D-erythritol kinase [Tepidisphaeraceae bacterium]|jgi:4-diphosphocytidyl-2-C-methyl-D-erythritol kinase|nr:4-(cytidine 5'-diphospho)-2-C-methyl-D-erythritol kinase [Tepidisphaeraceae bacterium]
MRLLCPAKINLHLRVGGLRGDGFHPLLSWFCTTGLFDTLILKQAAPFPAANDERPLISLRCDSVDLPCDRRNLVVKVGDAWGREAMATGMKGITTIVADLQKRIPAGAGLGGGSSDGARTLLGLNSLWGAGRSADELSEFAGRFGSDLPFFFFGPSSICQGRGEIVTPTPRPAPRAVLLILPPIAMPTGDVYRAFDAMKLGGDHDVERAPDWSAWSRLKAVDLLERLVNDLEAPAFAINPQLSKMRDEIDKTLGRPVRMSGSGSSLFTLYDSPDESDRARHILENRPSLAGVTIKTVELAVDVVDDLKTQTARSI